MIRYLIDDIQAAEARFDSADNTEQRIKASHEIGKALLDFIDMLEIELKALLPLRDALRIPEKEKTGVKTPKTVAPVSSIPVVTSKLPALPGMSLMYIPPAKTLQQKAREIQAAPRQTWYASMPTENWLHMKPGIRKIVHEYMFGRLTPEQYQAQMQDVQGFMDPLPLEQLVLMVKDLVDERASYLENPTLEAAFRSPKIAVNASLLRMFNQKFRYKGSTDSLVYALVQRLSYIDGYIDRWVDRYYGGPLPRTTSKSWNMRMTFFLYESTPVHELFFREAGNRKKSKFTDSAMLRPLDNPLQTSYTDNPATIAIRYAELLGSVASSRGYLGITKPSWDWNFLLDVRPYRVPVKRIASRHHALYRTLFRSPVAKTGIAPKALMSPAVTAYKIQKELRPDMVREIQNRFYVQYSPLPDSEFRTLYRKAPLERSCFASARLMLSGLLSGYIPSSQGRMVASAFTPYLPNDATPEFKAYLACIGDLLMPHHEIYRDFFMELMFLLYGMQGCTEKFLELAKTEAFKGFLMREYPLEQNITDLIASLLPDQMLALIAAYAFPPGEKTLEEFTDSLKKSNRQKTIENTLKPGFHYFASTEDKNNRKVSFRPNYLFMWMQHILKYINDNGLRYPQGTFKRVLVAKDTWEMKDLSGLIATEATQSEGKLSPVYRGESGKPEEQKKLFRRADVSLPPFMFKASDKGKTYDVVVHRVFTLRNGRAKFTDFQMMMLLDENKITELDLGSNEHPNEENLTRLSNQLLYLHTQLDSEGKLGPLQVKMRNIEILSTMMDDRFTPHDVAKTAIRNSLRHAGEAMQNLKEDLEGEGLDESQMANEIAREMEDLGYDLQELVKADQLIERVEQQRASAVDEDSDEEEDSSPVSEPEFPEDLTAAEFYKDVQDRYARLHSEEDRKNLMLSATEEFKRRYEQTSQRAARVLKERETPLYPAADSPLMPKELFMETIEKILYPTEAPKQEEE